jgi:uncharacterized membrane protein YhaH (DUF805 family)
VTPQRDAAQGWAGAMSDGAMGNGDMQDSAAEPAGRADHFTDMPAMTRLGAAVTGMRPSRLGGRLLSLSERLGRVRYLVYGMVAALASSAILIAVYLVASRVLPPAMYVLVAQIAYTCVAKAALPAVFAVLSIRRLHDINARGWWVLLLIIPGAAAVLACLPGSKEANNYGPVPPRNGQALVASAIVLPILLIALFLTFARTRGPQPPAAPGTIVPYDATTAPASPVPRQQPAGPLRRYGQ